jgi:hypothetical protein
MTGGQPHVRNAVAAQEARWKWWDAAGQPSRRPGASLVLLRPGMPFEAGAPPADAQQDLALRLRLWRDNTQQGKPAEPRAEFVSLHVDGKPVSPELRETPADLFLIASLRRTPGEHRAEAQVRLLASGALETHAISWRD